MYVDKNGRGAIATKSIVHICIYTRSLYVPFAFVGVTSTEMGTIIELYTCGYLLRARKNFLSNFVLIAKIPGLAIGTSLVQVISLLEIHLLSQRGIYSSFNCIARHTNA